jgi:tRNA (guanosine-2'-O-)-methyltransferase
MSNAKKKQRGIRAPVDENLPPDLPPEVRRPARMRIVAARRLAGLTIVLDGVHDPHNIAAVLRSCEGFGLLDVHIVGAPKKFRVSRSICKGCHKWLQIHHHATPQECADVLHAEGFELWAAICDRDSVTLQEIDFTRKIALVFGAERDGVSKEIQDACDGKYIIKMDGFSQSLNVSVAAAVSIYTGCVKRRAALGAVTDLPQSEIDSLANGWIGAEETKRFRGCTPR